MKSIDELWEELLEHPDCVTATLWSIESVAEIIETNVDDNEEYYNPHEMTLEDCTKFIVTKNKFKFANIIDKFEEYRYEDNCWNLNLDDYELELN